MDALEQASAAATGLGDTPIERLAERVGGRVKVEAVFGAPVQQGYVMSSRWHGFAGESVVAAANPWPRAHKVPVVVEASPQTRSATSRSPATVPPSGEWATLRQIRSSSWSPRSQQPS